MLSIFPEILFLSPFAALFLRVAAGAVFGYAASRHIAQGDLLSRGVGGIEIICAVLLFAGLYTQPAAILGIALFLVHASIPRLRVVPVSAGFLLLTICISLLLTGPGAFAFDLPL